MKPARGIAQSRSKFIISRRKSWKVTRPVILSTGIGSKNFTAPESVNPRLVPALAAVLLKCPETAIQATILLVHDWSEHHVPVIVIFSKGTPPSVVALLREMLSASGSDKYNANLYRHVRITEVCVDTAAAAESHPVVSRLMSIFASAHQLSEN